MEPRQIAELVAFFWAMGLIGYVIRIILCRGIDG